MSGLVLKKRPIIVGVGGLTSNVGKTSLVCELLKYFPDWEAIKTTRGHYRSCGKDPHACCVSHLLTDEPIIRSGYELTYAKDKDTGRYWDAGAANVHWLIATDDQIEKGIHEALGRVHAPGVFIEGNSFTEYVASDLFIMVARTDSNKVKSTARRALNKASAVYLSGDGISEMPAVLKNVTDLREQVSIISPAEFTDLVKQIEAINSERNGVLKPTRQAAFAS